MEIAVKDLAGLVGGIVEGDGDVKINNICKIEEGVPNAISFLSNPKYESHIYTTKASAVIVKNTFVPTKAVATTLIKVQHLYMCFTLLLEQYERMMNLELKGRHALIQIGNNTTIGEGEYIGAFAFIGNNVTIGKNVIIHPQAFIGNNVTIGDNTIVMSGVRILDRTIIGSHCTFHPNSVVGSDGFGFAPQANGEYKRIPQLGNVVIGNHVSVGTGTCIDCATMGSTVIGDGVKLDNLIQIAHNVEIGANTVMAAMTAIAGSAKIGKNCIFGGKAASVGHIKIGDGCIVGPHSTAVKSINNGEIIFGSPGFERKASMKSFAIYKNLPDLHNRIKQLEEKILTLASV